MKCVVFCCSIAILAFILIVQVNATKLNEQYKKYHEIYLDTGINLIQSRFKGMENLALELTRVPAYEKKAAPETPDVQALYKMGADVFYTYRSEEKAIKQKFDECLYEIELSTMAYFQVGNILEKIDNKTMAACEKKKLGNTKITCIAPDFQSIIRNTYLYTNTIDGMMQLARNLEGEMKNQTDKSLNTIRSSALIVQANKNNRLHMMKLDKLYKNFQDNFINTCIELMKIRIEGMENLELALLDVVKSLDNLVNNNNNDHFQQDITTLMQCLTEKTKKIFQIYREEKLAIKQKFDDKINGIEVATMDFFEAKELKTLSASNTAALCRENKLSTSNVNCTAPLTETIDITDKSLELMNTLGNIYKTEMKDQLTGSTYRFNAVANITETVESCLKKN